MKTCKVCLVQFVPARPMQVVCRPLCAITYSRIKRDKAAAKAAAEDRRQTRAALAKIKPRAQWLREAQEWVNKYVRLRDAHLGCVSCDKPAIWGGQWHASHLRSVGAAASIRFHLWNIQKSCSICNNWKSGNLLEYEPRLRARIGDERVDWLRAQNQRAEYSVEYLERLKDIFRRKARRLEARTA